MIDCVREVLERYQAEYRDSTTFEEEEEIILQYLVFFAKPPFTLQRIAELIVDTGRYYKSSRKLLYAFEKVRRVLFSWSTYVSLNSDSLFRHHYTFVISLSSCTMDPHSAHCRSDLHTRPRVPLQISDHICSGSH